MSLTELQEKERRLRAALAERGLDALLVRNISNFAWLTGGVSNYVGIATAEGNSWLLLTPTGKQIITNNIEAARLEKDELLAGQGINLAVFPWHGAAGDLVAKLTQGLKLGADGNLSGAQRTSATCWRRSAWCSCRRNARSIGRSAAGAARPSRLRPAWSNRG